MRVQIPKGLPQGTATGNLLRWDGTKWDTAVPIYANSYAVASLLFATASNSVAGSSNLTYNSTNYNGLYVNQATLGNQVLQLQSTASSDDPTLEFSQYGASIAANVLTTVGTWVSTSAASHILSAYIIAKCTIGGDTLAPGDLAAYVIRGAYKNIAGTLTLVGAVTVDYSAESNAIFNATFTLSSPNVLIQFNNGDTQAGTTSVVHVTLLAMRVTL